MGGHGDVARVRGGKLLRDVVHEDVHLRLSLLSGNARFEMADAH
jgi:hypothetical protein